MMNEEEIKEFLEKAEAGRAVAKKVKFPQLTPAPLPDNVKVGINYLGDIPVELSAVLGEASLTVREVLNLQPGSVIELNRPAGETVDLYANQQVFGRGEVIVIGGNFGVRVDRIYAPEDVKGEAR